MSRRWNYSLNQHMLSELIRIEYASEMMRSISAGHPVNCNTPHICAFRQWTLLTNEQFSQTHPTFDQPNDYCTVIARHWIKDRWLISNKYCSILMLIKASEKPGAIITASCHCSSSGGWEGGAEEGGMMSTKSWWWWSRTKSIVPGKHIVKTVMWSKRLKSDPSPTYLCDISLFTVIQPLSPVLPPNHHMRYSLRNYLSYLSLCLTHPKSLMAWTPLITFSVGFQKKCAEAWDTPFSSRAIPVKPSKSDDQYAILWHLIFVALTWPAILDNLKTQISKLEKSILLL